VFVVWKEGCCALRPFNPTYLFTPSHSKNQTTTNTQNSVTTFLLATEDPDDGCRLDSAVRGAPPRRPVAYDKGADLKFPPAGHSAAADTHQIDLNVAPMGHMTLAAGDSYPLVIRLEAAADGRSLDGLAPGAALPEWAQAQATYAKLVAGRDGGRPEVRVLKQKIFVAGAFWIIVFGVTASSCSPFSLRCQHLVPV
jgi:hypothetical protein